MLSGLVVSAQTKKPVAKKTTPATTVKTSAAAPAVLRTLSDSASYAIGISVANFYAQQGLSDLNAQAVSRAINDVLAKKQLLMNENEANSVIMRCMTQVQEAKSQPNIAAGEKFLAANKTKQGIQTTASGLQYEVLKAGTGAKPTAADSVTVHYMGTLIDGTEFDNSYKRGEPITFPLGGVIRGWTEGVQLMPVGSKYRFFIPQQLAYGTNDVGSIPAGSVLIFEVELLDIPSQKK
jgi:FKBP-type peptidyl-prolyl cis-trans isomerase FklB